MLEYAFLLQAPKQIFTSHSGASNHRTPTKEGGERVMIVQTPLLNDLRLTISCDSMFEINVCTRIKFGKVKVKFPLAY
jgi:hypothetical protein